MRRPVRPFSPALVLALFCLIVSTTLACRTVEPWERAAFAKRRMQSEPHAPHQGLLEHVRQSREAMATGGAPSGAGCGCY